MRTCPVYWSITYFFNWSCMNIVQKIVYESFARILENIVLPKCHLKFHDSVLASFSSLLLSLLLFLRIKGPLSFLRPAFSTEEEQCLSTSSLFSSSCSTQPLLSEHLCQCFSPTLQSSSIRSSLNTYLHMLTRVFQYAQKSKDLRGWLVKYVVIHN